MNNDNSTIQDVLDILSGKRKVGAEVVTSVDKSYNQLVLQFWLFGLIAFVIGVLIWKFIIKK